LRTQDGPVAVELPRDREGSFEPRIVPKHGRSFDGLAAQYADDSGVMVTYTCASTTARPTKLDRRRLEALRRAQRHGRSP
jgi:hypothetical protein